jgi:8-oxo-dGTP pyrophosphatase MutT (NUDIX family)
MDQTSQAVDMRLAAISSSLYRLAVKAVIVHDHKLLVVKEAGDDWWSLPGGGIEYSETPGQALGRELVEELGIPVGDYQTDGQLILATTTDIVDGIPKANLFMRVQLLSEPVVPTTDVDECRWVTSKELSELTVSPSAANAIKHLLDLLD